uniref:Uncharacterized LOC100184555 n=1 Tax=Ciona intestinalis TaxID=7719 RepID=F6X7V3_CIOIN|nr:uncharacterized protein LOC100184555 [Ciona intestinalis]|eukprot:XP_002124868.1 uncharacterized protein LOC100184555 [Ciona intestinalis]
MKLFLTYFTLVFFICLGDTFPLGPETRSLRMLEGESRPTHHHHHNHHHSDEDVNRLRRLDQIIGRIEDAAISRESDDEPIPDVDASDLSSVADVVSLVDNVVDTPDVKLNQLAFQIIALPHKFSRYDLNRDGYVTQLELAESTGTLLEDCADPFERADKDGDGLLTKEELHQAPWVFNERAR